MPATFNIPTQIVIPGQIIASALWNGEFKNIFDNFTPGGMDDYSNTSSQMQTQTDPFPGSVLSLPTALSGEMERDRYVLAGIKGTTYWYEPPVRSIANLNTAYLAHGHSGGDAGPQITVAGIADSAVTTPKIADGNVTQAKLAVSERFPAGTRMVFVQAAAPVGWTQDTTINDRALRVTSGAGNGQGGSYGVSTGHSHTVNPHTHNVDHTHSFSATTSQGSAGNLAQTGGQLQHAFTTHTHSVSGSTSSSSSPTSGAASDSGTNQQIVAYVDAIICTKS